MGYLVVSIKRFYIKCHVTVIQTPSRCLVLYDGLRVSWNKSYDVGIKVQKQGVFSGVRKSYVVLRREIRYSWRGLV